MTTKASSATDHAVAHIAEPMVTPEQMVTVGSKYTAGIAKSPNLASAPDVKTANDAWTTENGNLTTANQTVAQCEAALATARSNQAAVVRRWQARCRGCLNAINVYADGSKDLVASFSVGVAERTASPLETVPTGLEGVRSKTAGTASWKWKTHKGNHGYMVQHCTNPSDPTTFSVPVYASAGKLSLSGLTPGATVYLRVAACDPRLPARQTDYTVWISVLVSA
jgi:hypothetical protein